MMPSPENRSPLERAVHAALRDLPPRRAPHSLEARVLAELARRAALPWWRKSFAHWPVPARAVFLVLIVGVVKLVLMGTVWAMADFDVAQVREAFANQFAWVESGLAAMRMVRDAFDLVLSGIPSLWLYGGAAFVALMYAAFLGLGTAAYRTLSASR